MNLLLWLIGIGVIGGLFAFVWTCLVVASRFDDAGEEEG